MLVEGTYVFNAGINEVWESFLSSDTLSDCVPGVQDFKSTDKDSFSATMKIGVASISGVYSGTIIITDKSYPNSLKMIVKGKGSGGDIRGVATLNFTARGNETEVMLTGEAQINGIIARVGQRLLGSTSKLLMNQFFNCMISKVGTR